MKCTQAEQAILLQDSGELGGLGRYQLGRHVAGCAACQAYQAELRATRAALHAVAAPALSAPQRAVILDAAGPDRRALITLVPTRQPVSWWRPALAAAALVALLSAAVHWYPGSSPNAPQLAESPAPAVALSMDDAVDAEIDALQALLVASLGDTTEASTAENLPDEDTLARELLALQETLL